MRYLVNSQEMKRCDKNTIETYGISSLALMERAALAVFWEVKSRFSVDDGWILAVCGAGNNGGDGFAVARLLHLAGYGVELYCPMDQARMTEEARRQYEAAKKYGVTECRDISGRPYALILDALFGVGLSRGIEGPIRALLEELNRMDAYRVSVDIASGILADSGQALGAAFRADLTVTFGFPKIGQLLYPGAGYTGELSVCDIGIDSHSFLGQEPQGRCVSQKDVKELLPKRVPYSNKGSYGKALIVAGSKDMAGAAYFAARAAYLSGCGLVRIFTVRENRDILLSMLPEAILTTYEEDVEGIGEALEKLSGCLSWADALLVGPGLGQGEYAQAIVTQMLRAGKRLVLDADALNILSGNKLLLKELREGCIVTPHLGEMARLLGTDVAKVQGQLLTAAREFAKEHGAVCVLKDARTVIGMPDGTFFINASGNDGMATAGCGDVLAGVLAGLLAQGMPLGAAAAIGAYLHGMAGDMAKEARGAYGMVASDVLSMLPDAILRCMGQEHCQKKEGSE